MLIITWVCLSDRRVESIITFGHIFSYDFIDFRYNKPLSPENNFKPFSRTDVENKSSNFPLKI